MERPEVLPVICEPWLSIICIAQFSGRFYSGAGVILKQKFGSLTFETFSANREKRIWFTSGKKSLKI